MLNAKKRGVNVKARTVKAAKILMYFILLLQFPTIKNIPHSLAAPII